MMAAAVSIFLGSLGVIVWMVVKASFRIARATEMELQRRSLAFTRVTLKVLRFFRKARRYINIASLLRFFELILRRFRIYVLKLENLLMQMIRWSRGERSKNIQGEAYWKRMHHMRADDIDKNTSIANPLLDAEDFLGLNLDRREEVLEWPDLN